MKIRLVIIPNEGKQLVLTPEGKDDENILSIFNENNLKIFKSCCSYDIEECQGGYYRQYNNHKSVVIVIENKKCEPLEKLK